MLKSKVKYKNYCNNKLIDILTQNIFALCFTFEMRLLQHINLKVYYYLYLFRFFFFLLSFLVFLVGMLKNVRVFFRCNKNERKIHVSLVRNTWNFFRKFFFYFCFLIRIRVNLFAKFIVKKKLLRVYIHNV